MPGRSQIVFSAFSSLADPRLQGWATLRGHVHAGSIVSESVVQSGSRPDAALTRPDVATVQAGLWRLLAPNNRELGRSASVYSSFGMARAHVLRLQGLATEMVASAVVGPVAGTHGFYITLGETVVMTNGRWYGSVSTSLDGAAATIAALGGALVMSQAPVPGSSGTRRKRAQPGATTVLSW